MDKTNRWRNSQAWQHCQVNLIPSCAGDTVKPVLPTSGFIQSRPTYTGNETI
jgi:hypothetical protein